MIPFFRWLLMGLFLFLEFNSPGLVLNAQEDSIGLQPAATSTIAPNINPSPTVSAPVSQGSLETLGQDHPWLSDLYQWNESYNLDKGGVSAQKAGAYCVGNGHSFALIGLESPLWDWSNIYGDSYQEPDLGHFQMGISRDGS